MQLPLLLRQLAVLLLFSFFTCANAILGRSCWCPLVPRHGHRHHQCVVSCLALGPALQGAFQRTQPLADLLRWGQDAPVRCFGLCKGPHYNFSLLLCTSPTSLGLVNSGVSLRQTAALKRAAQKLIKLPESVSPTATCTMKTFCDNCWQQWRDGDHQAACIYREVSRDFCCLPGEWKRGQREIC